MKHLLSTALVALLAVCIAPRAQAHDNDDHNCNSGGKSKDCHDKKPHGSDGGCQVTLSCDAGGPYVVDTQPGSVVVQLDGTGAFGALTWHWSTNFPGATFDDANLPNAMLTIPVSGGCSFDVNVVLTVTRNTVTKSCNTTVKVRDRVKPVIVCPEFTKVPDGSSTSPESTGFATATDNCDQNVHVSYCDRIICIPCPADRLVRRIERTWKAVDDDCNVAKCVQIIDIDKFYAYIDVLPGVCPNLYNRNATSLVPIAITGLNGFDATQIQWCSIRLWGLKCSAGPVAPECLQLADVATPFFNSPACDCTTENGDGTVDLVAKFSRCKINAAFGLSNVAAGTAIPVIITGRLCNGIQFLAQDCIVVQ